MEENDITFIVLANVDTKDFDPPSRSPSNLKKRKSEEFVPMGLNKNVRNRKGYPNNMSSENESNYRYSPQRGAKDRLSPNRGNQRDLNQQRRLHNSYNPDEEPNNRRHHNNTEEYAFNHPDLGEDELERFDSSKYQRNPNGGYSFKPEIRNRQNDSYKPSGYELNQKSLGKLSQYGKHEKPSNGINRSHRSPAKFIDNPSGLKHKPNNLMNDQMKFEENLSIDPIIKNGIMNGRMKYTSGANIKAVDNSNSDLYKLNSNPYNDEMRQDKKHFRIAAYPEHSHNERVTTGDYFQNKYVDSLPNDRTTSTVEMYHSNVNGHNIEEGKFILILYFRKL